jgi:hypothetical protein
MGFGTRSPRLRLAMVTAASGVLAAAAAIGMAGSAGAATAGAAVKAAPAVPSAGYQAGYQFVTAGSDHDKTFNQLLGINNEGVIAGYFGSGIKNHPNKGYQIVPPYAQGDIHSENFPNSAQTQVTGLNDKGVTVGFFSKQNTASNVNNNFGWYASGGHFHEVNFPTGTPAKPPVDQLLGVNNHDIAVGFFTNSGGFNRGYAYNIATKKFSRVLPPGGSNSNPGPSLTAYAINDEGDVAGFYNVNSSTVDGFLKLANGDFIKLVVPVADVAMTQPFGVNNSDTVVGTYTLRNGDTFGFLYRLGHGYTTNISDPDGVGTTVLNGINNEGDIVGFYTASGSTNVDGLIAYPAF